MTKGILIYSNSLEPLPASFVGILQQKVDVFYVIQMLREEKSMIALPNQFKFENVQILNVQVKQSILGKIVAFLSVLRIVIKISPSLISAWNWELIFLSRLYSLFWKVSLFPSIQDTREWMYTKYGKLFMSLIVGTDRLHLTSEGYVNPLFRKTPKSDLIIVPNVPLSPSLISAKPESSELKTIAYFGFIRGDYALNKILDSLNEINSTELKLNFLFAGIGPGVDVIVKSKARGVNYLGSYQHADLPKMYEKVDAIFGVYDESSDKKFHSSYRYMDAIHYSKSIFLLEDSNMFKELKPSGLAYPLRFDQKWTISFNRFVNSSDNKQDLNFIESLKKKYSFSTYVEPLKNHYSIEPSDNSKY